MSSLRSPILLWREVLIDAARIGLDLGNLETLRRYERWRRFDAAVLVGATDGINRLFSNDNPILRLGRDLGLAAVGRWGRCAPTCHGSRRTARSQRSWPCSQTPCAMGRWC